jgi:hypothetical protein
MLEVNPRYMMLALPAWVTISVFGTFGLFLPELAVTLKRTPKDTCTVESAVFMVAPPSVAGAPIHDF